MRALITSLCVIERPKDVQEDTSLIETAEKEEEEDEGGDDEEDLEEKEERRRRRMKERDQAQAALPTLLLAGTIFGAVFQVDLTKVRVDVDTNELSKSCTHLESFGTESTHLFDVMTSWQFAEFSGRHRCTMAPSKSCVGRPWSSSSSSRSEDIVGQCGETLDWYDIMLKLCSRCKYSRTISGDSYRIALRE